MKTLKEIIPLIGTDYDVAEKVGVKPRTVKSWRLGDRRPRVQEAVRLAELCPEPVTLDDVYRTPAR